MTNSVKSKNDKSTYYIYHIPGKKIGVTRNIYKRVTLVQGYKKGEYEVLEESTDIDHISNRELELQKQYGYKVDRQKYSNLIKSNRKMKLNVTEATTTFPCDINQLKGCLKENKGQVWDTLHGEFTLDKKTIKWIAKNARTSMYNDARTYVYNKALSESDVIAGEFKSHKTAIGALAPNRKKVSVYDNIREWATIRGIYEKGDLKTQYCKLGEEFGELGRAIIKNDKAELIDVIGDIVVVLTNVAELADKHFDSDRITIESCIDSAYKVISARKGSMINGSFVKETPITIRSGFVTTTTL